MKSLHLKNPSNKCGTISQTKVNSGNAAWKIRAVFSFQEDKMNPRSLCFFFSFFGFKFY